jgi:hypothetical protein
MRSVTAALSDSEIDGLAAFYATTHQYQVNRSSFCGITVRCAEEWSLLLNG